MNVVYWNGNGSVGFVPRSTPDFAFLQARNFKLKLCTLSLVHAFLSYKDLNLLLKQFAHESWRENLDWGIWVDNEVDVRSLQIDVVHEAWACHHVVRPQGVVGIADYMLEVAGSRRPSQGASVNLYIITITVIVRYGVFESSFIYYFRLTVGQ